MAVKIGTALGCRVTVISRGRAKEAKARELGAVTFVDSTDQASMDSAAYSLDYIFDSIAFVHPVKPYLKLLRSRGTLIMVGGVPKALDVEPFTLLMRGLVIAGSLIGGIKATQDMLNFCAEKQILSDIELISVPSPSLCQAVDTAYDRAVVGDVQFRFVIDIGKCLPDPPK